MNQTRTDTNRKWYIAAAILGVVLAVAGYFVNYRNPEPPARPPEHVMVETDCSTLATLEAGYLDAFHVELDRVDSDPARRQMYLDYAEGTNDRRVELGCP